MLRRRMGQRLSRANSSPSRYWISRCLWPVIGSLSASSMSSMPKSRVRQGGTRRSKRSSGLGSGRKA